MLLARYREHERLRLSPASCLDALPPVSAAAGADTDEADAPHVGHQGRSQAVCGASEYVRAVLRYGLRLDPLVTHVFFALLARGLGITHAVHDHGEDDDDDNDIAATNSSAGADAGTSTSVRFDGVGGEGGVLGALDLSDLHLSLQYLILSDSLYVADALAESGDGELRRVRMRVAAAAAATGPKAEAAASPAPGASEASAAALADVTVDVSRAAAGLSADAAAVAPLLHALAPPAVGLDSYVDLAGTQLALDMYLRLGASARILKLYLSRGLVIAALRLVAHRSPLFAQPGLGPADFMRVALAPSPAGGAPDKVNVYTAFRFFQQRNIALRGSPAFVPEDRCEEWMPAVARLFPQLVQPAPAAAASSFV
jgi:hypothetical protein